MPKDNHERNKLNQCRAAAAEEEEEERKHQSACTTKATAVAKLAATHGCKLRWHNIRAEEHVTNTKAMTRIEWTTANVSGKDGMHAHSEHNQNTMFT